VKVRLSCSFYAVLDKKRSDPTGWSVLPGLVRKEVEEFGMKQQKRRKSTVSTTIMAQVKYTTWEHFVKPSIRNTPKKLLTRFVNNRLCLPDRQIKLFCKPFERDAINQPALENLTVPLRIAPVYIAVNIGSNLNVVGIVAHQITAVSAFRETCRSCAA
jgi:hypothetical protein